MMPTLDLAACLATDWQGTPDLLLRMSFIGGLVLLSGWTVMQRFFPGQHSFAVLLVVMALWLAATTAGNAAVDPACKASMALLAWPVILAQPVLWALFLHQYVNTRTGLPPRHVVAGIVLAALVLIVAALSNGSHGLLYGAGSYLGPPELGVPRMRYERGPLFVPMVLWGYGWLSVALIILVRALRQAGAGERRQWAVLLFLMAIPVVASVAFVAFGWRLLGADPTPLSFGVTAIAFTWLIRRSELFTAVPLARQLLFAELPDAVLVLDRRGRVHDANRAAEGLAGSPQPPGRPLREWPRFGARLAEVLDGGRPELLALPDGSRVFEVAVRELGSGRRALGRLVQLRDVTERHLSQAALERSLAERSRQLQQVAALQDELREQALHDPLTGLLNRRALTQRYAAEAGHLAAQGRPLSLVLLDLDHFKRINDSAGHAVGDTVLRTVAQRLRAGLRGGDTVFRVGGEEFALLLPSSDLAGAMRRVQALRESIAATPIAGAPGPVTLSAGVAEQGRHGQALEALYRAADAAMYRAKQAGRNRVEAATDPDAAD